VLIEKKFKLIFSPATRRMASTLLDPNDPETFTKCASFLSSGGCVAFPTETVYGLGANALSKDAVKISKQVFTTFASQSEF